MVPKAPGRGGRHADNVVQGDASVLAKPFLRLGKFLPDALATAIRVVMGKYVAIATLKRGVLVVFAVLGRLLQRRDRPTADGVLVSLSGASAAVDVDSRVDPLVDILDSRVAESNRLLLGGLAIGRADFLRTRTRTAGLAVSSQKSFDSGVAFLQADTAASGSRGGSRRGR